MLALRKENDIIKRRNLFTNPYLQRKLLVTDEFLSDTQYLRYPIHLQYSTDLVPGKYKLFLERLLLYVDINNRDEEYDVTLGDKPIEFEVQPKNMEILKGIYENLYRDSLAVHEKAHEKWVGFGLHSHNDFELPSCMRTLLWAWGKEAIPSQIRFLFDDNGMSRTFCTQSVHTYQNIIEFAGRDDVENLVKIAMSDRFKQEFETDNYDAPLLIWAIQKLHEKGNADIKVLTQGVMERFQEPIDIEYIRMIGVNI